MSDGVSPFSDAAQSLTAARAALARLSAMALPDEARAAVSEAQAALQAIPESPREDGIDNAMFDALLEMAGPDVARDLLIQMHTDLITVQFGLTSALVQADFGQIRAHTHVLSALAGAAGAKGLEAAARQMNMAAYRADGAQVGQLEGRVLPGLSTLIAFVESARQTWNAQAK